MEGIDWKPSHEAERQEARVKGAGREQKRSGRGWRRERNRSVTSYTLLGLGGRGGRGREKQPRHRI